MRAPFTGTATLLDGPGTATPGFPRITDLPCRIVSDPYFIDVNPPTDTAVTYITCDGSQPRGPTTTDLGAGKWEYDYSKADRVELSLLPGTSWVVVRVELCTWPDQVSYWRATLALVEAPPPATCSDGYAPMYRVTVISTGEMIDLNRLAPTFWVGSGGWILVAENDGPPDAECRSVWTLEKGIDDWREDNYDGSFGVAITPVLPNTTIVSLNPIY